ncbi:DUF6412 domain-containing protein [Nocardiopsis composta]|uniref:Uncharacterized protein n=1 Tax=Nocardiopsis composta TaxID=157465 RepID=A0A7W8QMN2_9ACTN|nr:DUF6412 domain-containing protein [Nocardiopsis composta]MBB5433258.1 hypothetical protein [Nocardiopsis composta]
MAVLHTLLYTLLPALLGTDPAPELFDGTALGGVALLAVVAVGAALAWAAVRAIATWPPLDGAGTLGDALRRRAERTPVAPAIAPDTPGKPRPRAPGAAPAAA